MSGIASALLGFGGPIAQDWLNAGQIDKANQIADDRFGQAAGYIDDNQASLNNLQQQWMGSPSGINMPSAPSLLPRTDGFRNAGAGVLGSTPNSFVPRGASFGSSAATGGVDPYGGLFNPADFDPSNYEVDVDYYGGQFDPSRFDPSNFQSSTDFESLLASMRGDISGKTGEGIDWLQSGTADALGLLSDARLDPEGRADTAMGYFSDIDTDAFERSAINSISAESRNRLGNSSGSTIANILSRGGSLGESRGALDALKYNEGIARSNAIDSVAADAAGMRNDNMQKRAGAGALALANADNSNVSLAGVGANLTGASAQAGANLLAGEGEALANAELGVSQFQDTSNRADQLAGNTANVDMLKLLGLESSFEHDQQAGNVSRTNTALMNMLAAEMNSTQFKSGLMQMFAQAGQQNAISRAGLRMGTDYAIPQGSGFTEGANNYMQMQAMDNQPDQKGGWNVAFVGGMSCVDSRTRVTTDRGETMLSDVQRQDRVLGTDGCFRRVVAKDCGVVPEEQQHEMTSIGTLDGDSIRITPEHILGDRPAGQWKAGDKIVCDGREATIAFVGNVPYHRSGDLMLEGNVPYLANGFPVVSMIGEMGLDEFRKNIRNEGATQYGKYWVSDQNANDGVWVEKE